jgi:Tfp pilus assembly protein PilX
MPEDLVPVLTISCALQELQAASARMSDLMQAIEQAEDALREAASRVVNEQEKRESRDRQSRRSPHQLQRVTVSRGNARKARP